MGLIKTALDELTYKVNGLAMQVQHELKPGHRERIYQHRLFQRLVDAGCQTDLEKQVEVYVNDALVGYMYLDLWVEQTLVVECKAHNNPFSSDEIGQVITYLAATGSPMGLLYNFGRPKLELKRILPPKNVQEWHKHLYRCMWTSNHCPIPPLETLPPQTPIRFSVVSPASGFSVSARLSESPAASVGLRGAASPSAEHPSAYAAAGVSIDAGNRAVELMRNAVRSTHGTEVLAGVGAFGGLFDASALKDMRAPVLVASTDGVGTKVRLAAQANRYDSIGQDIVNHCVDDILVHGARPLFFLDYFASSRLDPETVAEIVAGMAAACREAGCALLGGETAEMPGVYAPGEFDVAGTIVGVVDRSAVLPCPDLRPGDLLLGLRSSGPHTNGYSLIRKVFEDTPLETVFLELGLPLADALLAPHRSYLPLLRPLLTSPGHPVKALAHVTGGGFIENIPRVLPDGLGAVIHPGSWPVPPLFQLIQQRGDIRAWEMHRVFNMGIGMIAVVAPEDLAALQAAIPEDTWVIGQLVPGERRVSLA